jgi:acyl-CoA thioester hydrolase
MIELAHIRALPQTHQATIPPSFMDEMGHMNIQYYVHLYDRAAWALFAQVDLTLTRLQTDQNGMFALKQFIQYLAEVQVGETVTIHSRWLGVSAKRVHFMHFMVNETTNVLASTFEVLASHADLTVRRTAPFTEEVAARLRERVTADNALSWNVPVCGVLQP